MPKERFAGFFRHCVDESLQKLIDNRLDHNEATLSGLKKEVGELSTEVRELTTSFDRLMEIVTAHPLEEKVSNSIQMSEPPVVSVILPTWNRAGPVSIAIQSVIDQSFQNWELIIVDDGSIDHTRDAVKQYLADIRIKYLYQENAGSCNARNAGLLIASGSLFAYLDSDNLWYPEFLSFSVAAFERHPSIDFAYGALVSEVHGRRLLWEKFDRQRLLEGNYIDTSTIIHRRKLYEEYGGFDQATSPFEDWDLVLRYTSHADAYRLPVLAARYRSVDDIRISDTKPKQAPNALVRNKWNRTST